MVFISYNPANGEVNEEFAEHTREEVSSILAGCREAYTGWSGLDLDHRASLVKKPGKRTSQYSKGSGTLAGYG